MGDSDDVTRLLNRWTEGDAAAGEALAPMVYDELRRVARRVFAGESAGHTLQATALVHEAFAKLIDVDVTWQDRAHFYALSARMMRRLLVNHANARLAEKRGGGDVKVTLDPSELGGGSDAEFMQVHEALNALAEIDARKAELIELQYFGGLTFKEMGQVTGLSSSTLDRDLRMARAWLKDYLARD